ncbi:MAG: hypothetical protein NVSMB56_18180 [Pyrinomonadaceae bacterium]
MSEQQATATEQTKQNVSPKHGEICWAELASKDIEAATKFYGELLGWTITKSNAAGMDYREFHVGERSIGGMYQLTKEFGDMPTHWMSYVSVDDVDATAKRVAELGGKVCVPPSDIPNVGRFCVINDPTGGTISLITLGGK